MPTMIAASSNSEHTYRDMEGCDHVLLADENAEEAAVVEEILIDASFYGQLHKFGDWDQAMAFLRQEGRFSDGPRPDLILAELKIAEGEGRQVIHVHGDPDVAQIPLVILCGSTSGGSLMASTHAGPIHYLAKPRNFIEYQEAVKAIGAFWRRVAGQRTSRLNGH